MKYINNRKEFINETQSKGFRKYNKEITNSVNEMFQNDVTLADSLLGQLFSWVGRQIGAGIKKGQMSKLLQKLDAEFNKGQYGAIRHENTIKKGTVYTIILNLKRMVNDNTIGESDFKEEFTEQLENGLDDMRGLIQGKGDEKIKDPELMGVAKDFYDKLNKLSDKSVKLEKELNKAEKEEDNREQEEGLEDVNIDETLSLIPNYNLNNLMGDDNKLEIIGINIENQLGMAVNIKGDLLTIEESVNFPFREIDNYFDALNIVIEPFNESYIVTNYDKYAMLLEARSTEDFVRNVYDYISYVLLRPIKLDSGSSILGAIGMSTEKDYGEKGDVIANVLKDIHKKSTIIDDIKEAKELGNGNLINLLQDLNSNLENTLDSVDDSSGFRTYFKKLKSTLVSLKKFLGSEIDRRAKEDKQRENDKPIESKSDGGNDKNKENDSSNKSHDGKYKKKTIDRVNDLFPNDKEYEKEVLINEKDRKDLLNIIKHKASDEEELINPIQVMKIFNKAHYKYTIENFSNIPDGSKGTKDKQKRYKKMPDGSGRNIKLFKQWNEGVLDLIEQYSEYIPKQLKKFIVEVLDSNEVFAGGAQGKLLQEYFDVKVDDKTFSNPKKKTPKNDSKEIDYSETNDYDGEFTKVKNSSIQLNNDNITDGSFILEGSFSSTKENTAIVCFYLNEYKGNVLFKYKENNTDFLDNYKLKKQSIDEPDFDEFSKDEVNYGVIKPLNNNDTIKKGDTLPIRLTDVDLDSEGDVDSDEFIIDDIYYLVGEDDKKVMKLDTSSPSSNHNDKQNEIKTIWEKFTNKT